MISFSALKSRLKQPRSKTTNITLIILMGLVIIQLLVLGVNTARPQSPILGQRYNGQPVSFTSFEHLQQLVKGSINTAEKRPILVQAGSYRGHLLARQLGARYSSVDVTQDLLSSGRQGTWWQVIKTQDLALIGRQNQVLGFPKVNKKLSHDYSRFVAYKADTLPRSASFSMNQGKLTIVSDKTGLMVDQAKAVAVIKAFDPTQAAKLSLPVKAKKAILVVDDLRPLLPKVQQIVSQPVVVNSAEKQITLNPEQVLLLIKTTKSPDPVTPSRLVATIGHDDKAIAVVLDQLAAQVAVAPKPKIVSGNRVLDPGLAGRQVDGPHAIVAVMAELSNRRDRNKVNPQVAIPVQQLDPPVVVRNAEPAPLGKFPAYTFQGGAVTLTFDDGPNNTYTVPILDILKKYNAHAIFFVVGRNVASYADVAKRIKADGHTLGNHSYTHSQLSRLSAAAVSGELSQTQAIVNKVAGLSPNLFRPPYGATNVTVNAQANAQGMQVMMWSVDPRDWSQPGSKIIADRVLSGAVPGSNILLHVLHQQTVDALPAIIEGIRAKGLVIN